MNLLTGLSVLLLAASGVGMTLLDEGLFIVAALGLQYAAAAFLLSTAIAPLSLLAKAAGWVGTLAILVAGIRAQKGGSGEMPARATISHLFRAFAMMLILVAAVGFALRGGLPLPEIPLEARLATAISLATGLLVMGISHENPLTFGSGLLTMLVGFDISYSLVEPSLAVLALMTAVNLGIALNISYLLQQAAAGERHART